MLFFALMMVILLYSTLFLTNICQYFFVRFAKMCKKIESIWTSIRHQIDDLNHPNIHFLVVSEMQQNPTALSALPTNIIFHEIEKKISVKKSILKSSSLRANAESKFILNTFFARKDRRNYEIQSYDKILLFLLLSDYDCKLQFFQLSSHFQLHYYCM